MRNFIMTLTGAAPMLMHNVDAADEFHPLAIARKKITDKKTKKTEDDRWELRRLEFVGGMYYDSDLGPYIPAENIEACLAKSAGLTRNGQDVKRGVRVRNSVNPLVYSGPRDIDGLWADENFRLFKSVKVGQSRITRTRPMFKQWAVEIDGMFDPSIIDFDQLREFTERAGTMIGLGDWRPRYGTFDSEIVEV